MNRLNDKYILTGIILLGALLRFGGIFEGLPAVYNSTEQFLAKYTLKMAANRTLDPGFYIYPSLYQYFLLMLYGIYYLFGLLFGIFQDSFDFAVHYLINPSGIFLIGRISSVCLSIISIWIIYNLAKKRFSGQLALLSASFMAFSYYILVFCRYAIHESFLIFFTVLALDRFWESLHNQPYKILFSAGLFSGLAIASKYNAGFLVFGLILSVYFSYRRFNDRIHLRLIYAFAGLFIGFLLPNPYWLISPEKYLSGFYMVTEQMNYGMLTERATIYMWEIEQILTHELLLGVLFIVSTVFALLKRNQYGLILLSIVLPTYLYVGSWDKKGIDYLLVCWPAFILLTTDYLNNYWKKIKVRSRLTIGIIFIVLFPLLLFNMYHTILLILPDTRQDASEWLLTNMGSKDKIYYDKNGYDLKLIDIRRYTEYGAHAKFLNNEIKDRLNSYKDLKRNVNFVMSVEYLVDLAEDSVFLDSQMLHSATRWKSLDEIIKEGVTWIVINIEFKQIYSGQQYKKVPESQKNIDAMRSFYSNLEKKYRPIKVIKNNFWRNGPEILIYNLHNKDYSRPYGPNEFN
ncbi:MAG: glycosyltransferase family 39 protein [Calditrichia bacterium]|nr:glycosyltransferase family 39 protein [Calditrichia bacterium]